MSLVERSGATEADLIPYHRRSNGDRTSAASSDLVQALNARLEAVKDSHRQEIKDLVAQRDELTREVAALRQTRDHCVEETSVLSLRNAALADKNDEATRQLDSMRESMSKLRLLGSNNSPLSNPAQRSNHHHTSSSASLLSNLPPVTTRSPLASGSRANPSSTTSSSYTEVDQLHRFNKPEAAEPQSGKKFKWGKGKTETPRPSHTAGASLTTKSPVVPRSNSADAGTRAHVFQQTSILRPVRCDYCGDKMWGLNEVRCQGGSSPLVADLAEADSAFFAVCGSYSHAKCAGYLQGGCNTAGHGQAQDDTLTIISQSPVMFGNDLVSR